VETRRVFLIKKYELNSLINWKLYGSNILKVGLSAIIKDRGPYIQEWVAFHAMVGVEKFYLYTHKCTDDTVEKIKKLQKYYDIKSFTVSDVAKTPQFDAYRHAYQTFNHEIDWMAFIDGDEFLFSPISLDIRVQLEKYSYKRMSALAVYWSCFGSGGHINEPKGLIIENFIYRSDLKFHKNQHIKSIVMGRQGPAVKINDPHVFETTYGTFDELLRPIYWGKPDCEPSHQYLRINHYVTQSRNYYMNIKMQTTRPDNGQLRDEAYWDEHDKNDICDQSLDKLIPDLKKILKSFG
jgi:hypothetical protein